MWEGLPASIATERHIRTVDGSSGYEGRERRTWCRHKSFGWGVRDSRRGEVWGNQHEPTHEHLIYNSRVKTSHGCTLKLDTLSTELSGNWELWCTILREADLWYFESLGIHAEFCITSSAINYRIGVLIVLKVRISRSETHNKFKGCIC